MRTRSLFAAAAVAAAVLAPAAPAAAVFCITLPTGHCVSPCDVNNRVWDTTSEATDGAVDGARCLN